MMFRVAALSMVLVVASCMPGDGSGTADARIDGGDGVSADTTDARDDRFEGDPDLWVGEFATGRLDPGVDTSFAIFLRQGERLDVDVYLLDGTGAVAVRLDGPSGALDVLSERVADDAYSGGFEIRDSGVHQLILNLAADAAPRGFVVRTRCGAGACLGPPASTVSVRLLGINDFHGQLSPLDSGVGGGALLAAHLAKLRAEAEHSLLFAAGDLIGGSAFASAFFHDEPVVELMNLVGLDATSVGNHEFDEGPGELLRLVGGGCHPIDGCRDGSGYDGADFDILAANVRTVEGDPILPDFTVRVVAGMPIAIIGLTLQGTPSVTIASQVSSLRFDDEARTVNALIPRIRGMGIETIVVLVHEGGFQRGGNNGCESMDGAIATIAMRIDNAVDVIFSGHTHATYNCVLGSKRVMSAGSLGRFVSMVDIVLATDSRDAVVTNAFNVTVDASLQPDLAATALLEPYLEIVDEVASQRIGTLAGPLGRQADDTGETPLGLVLADAHLFATAGPAGAQIAFMNRGGIRADLPAGDITFGQGFAVQPFENPLITVTISGADLEALLASQFAGGELFLLQPSASLRYSIEAVTPGSSALRLVPGSIMVDGLPLDPDAPYRVAANAFIADGDSILGRGTEREVGLIDSAAFVDYLAATPTPLPVPALDRVTRR